MQTDGAADVDFVGGDADFRAEAVLEAVGETGGGIDHDAGAVDRAQEGAGVSVGFGDDAVGVVAAVGVDVGDGFFEAVDDFDGEDGGEVFGVPVFFGGRLNVGQMERVRGQPRSSTLRAAYFSASTGRISAARLWWTSRVSMVLQVP